MPRHPSDAHAESDTEVLLNVIKENPIGILITGIQLLLTRFPPMHPCPIRACSPQHRGQRTNRPQTSRPHREAKLQVKSMLEAFDGKPPGALPLNGTKPDTGKVINGKLSLYCDSKTPEAGAFLAKQMHDLSEQCERNIMGFMGGERPQPWKRNVVGIQIEIGNIEGKFKMSQEMRRGDRDGVVRGFTDLGGEAGEAISSLVKEREELHDKKIEKLKAAKEGRASENNLSQSFYYMYKPAPPRPRKTNIIRSRNGCKSCRNRRTKCDEQKPICGTCARLDKSCEYVQPGLKFQIITVQNPKGLLSTYDIPSKERKQRLAGDERLAIQAEQGNPRIGGYDIVKSLQRTERDVFYSTYWEDRCLPALHPMFYSATLLTADYPILNDAILALSSCNISRLHSERKISSTGLMGPLSPSLTHQTRSHLYYSSAIRKLTAMTASDCRHNAAVVFIVLVLFAHLESAMGNFQGFYCHVQGMMNFLVEWRGRPGDATIMSLLTSWMQTRYVVWWARAYFSSLNIHQQLPSIPLPISMKEVPFTLHERRVKVLSIMCESHRLNFKAVLQRFKSMRSEEEVTNENNQGYFEYLSLLRQETTKLDEWLLHLPPSEQPIYELNDTSSTAIHFQSHDAALNYAYYVVARIMQCTGLLRELYSQTTPDHEDECYPAELWVQTLVQIAQGVDMRTSATRNSYTIGFSGLLLAGILRCQSLSVGLEIQDWIQTLQDLQPTEEGAFPLYQTLGVVKAVNQQRMAGRDVFAVTQPVDDGGGHPKVTAYNSQSISSLLFHGRCRIRNCLFEECITLGV
ncbi:hypothetical protein BDV24DRAFT_151028 [Aspergillus arachidicola]|uniref:Zn(2)-C6 fungal-type domain-containing protein n=1 Tax=Aspergillus arachidicola TaxID=656916 RepID=A0A5N6Y820_9EURO|nr:hypothetical protein BDV24DRAFT_151028 [Aspergillus arachidicola]